MYMHAPAKQGAILHLLVLYCCQLSYIWGWGVCQSSYRIGISGVHVSPPSPPPGAWVTISLV